MPLHESEDPGKSEFFNVPREMGLVMGGKPMLAGTDHPAGQSTWQEKAKEHEAPPKVSSDPLASSLEEVMAFRKALFDESMGLISQKGADYNRDQQLSGDTLFNLRVSELLNIVPTTERGILVRLSDKFMRLISLMAPGREPAVKNESVRDTVKDIHNYVDYALLIWEKRKKATV